MTLHRDLLNEVRLTLHRDLLNEVRLTLPGITDSYFESLLGFYGRPWVLECLKRSSGLTGEAKAYTLGYSLLTGQPRHFIDAQPWHWVYLEPYLNEPTIEQDLLEEVESLVVDVALSLPCEDVALPSKPVVEIKPLTRKAQ